MVNTGEIKLVVSGPYAGGVSRQELVAAIGEVSDMHTLSSLWKTDIVNVWFASFETDCAAGVLARRNGVMLSGSRVLKPMWLNKQEMTLQIHLMAPFVRDFAGGFW